MTSSLFSPVFQSDDNAALLKAELSPPCCGWQEELPDSLLPWITSRSLAPCHPSKHLHVHALTFCASLIHTCCNDARLICQGTSLLCWGEGRAPCCVLSLSLSGFGFFLLQIWCEKKEKKEIMVCFCPGKTPRQLFFPCRVSLIIAYFYGLNHSHTLTSFSVSLQFSLLSMSSLCFNPPRKVFQWVCCSAFTQTGGSFSFFVSLLNLLQTVLQHSLTFCTIRLLYPRVRLASEWINNGEADPCIMNEETTHPGTGACLLQNVYSVNYYSNSGDRLRRGKKKHFVMSFSKEWYCPSVFAVHCVI